MATPPTYSAMNHSPQMVQICAPEQRLHLAMSVTTQPTVRKRTKCSFTPPSDVLDDRGGERTRILHSRRSTDSTRWRVETGHVVMGLCWTGAYNRGEGKVNIQVKHRYLKNGPQSEYIGVHLNVLRGSRFTAGRQLLITTATILCALSPAAYRAACPHSGDQSGRLKQCEGSQCGSITGSLLPAVLWSTWGLASEEEMFDVLSNLSQMLAHTSAERFTAYICLLGLAQKMARVRPGVVVEFAEYLAGC